METVTIVSLYNKYLNTNNLIEIIVGVFEVNYIFKNNRNTNGKEYKLIMDEETNLFLGFLCNAWSNKIRATIFRDAVEEWIKTGSVPFHLIPRKDYIKYVRKSRFLSN